MSIASRARQEKRPSGDPKRVRHARPKPAPFNFTEFVKGAHATVVASNKIVLKRSISGLPTPGAFGGGSKVNRAARLATKPARVEAAKQDRLERKARKAAQKKVVSA